MERQRKEMEEEGTDHHYQNKEGTDHSLATAAMAVAVAAAAEKAAEEEEVWWGDGVEEEMTWSTVWLPFWDVEFVGRNYGVLFSDVVWDDDIWNLKNMTYSS